MRRSGVMLMVTLGGLLAMLWLGATPAHAEGEGLQGTLRNLGDNRPVPGVRVTVSAEAGQQVGSAVSGPDGGWSVPVPAAGRYTVELDTSTLPPGIGLTNNRPQLTLEVFTGNVRNVLFPLGPGGPAGPGPGGAEGEPATEPERSVWPRVVHLTYAGLHLGLIIALAALGLSLVFGTMGLTNFAHSEMVTFGAMAAFFVNVVLDVPLLLAAAVAVLLGAGAGWLQDRFFWGWLRRRRTGLVAMMIISIGLALLLRYVFLYQFGGESRPFADYVAQAGVPLGPIAVAPKSLVSDAVAVVVLVAISTTLVTTRLGTATRAVADNPALAAASGIDVDRIIRLVWTIGGGLAALSGVILGLDQNVSYQMGFQILLIVFAAVTLGGLGTAFGALVGSVLVGLFIQLSTIWVPSELKNVGALAVLILILLIRPQGILGRRDRVG